MKIVDGKGTGSEVEVIDNRLQVDSIESSAQNIASSKRSSAYQTSVNLSIASGGKNLLLLKNTSSKNIVVTYIRLMSIGAAASNESAYFTIEVGGNYVSGGASIEPTNLNVGKVVPAISDCYSGSTAIVDDGSYVEIDRSYEANSMQTYSKKGALVLPKGSSILITHVGSTAAGTAYARIAFYYERS